MKKVLPVILGIFMLFGASGHIATPEFYAAMIPSFIPESLAHIFAFITEAAVGITLIVPKYRRLGGLGLFALMIIFLPLHIWDIFRDDPVMGSTIGAWIRLGIQFLLIYAGWWIKAKYD